MAKNLRWRKNPRQKAQGKAKRKKPKSGGGKKKRATGDAGVEGRKKKHAQQKGKFGEGQAENNNGPPICVWNEKKKIHLTSAT